MIKGLPLEVIGLISPILCWVEGGERQGLPDSWSGDSCSFDERATAWLSRELPTYSYDNLDEILSLAMDPGKTHISAGLEISKGKTFTVTPPKSFNLVYMFHKLAMRYFKWAGNTLCVREERMVELHELAMRFPVSHLVCHCYADVVVRGYLSMERALELPFQMSRLHSTYHSLRTVVEEGLSEGHLHLNGVIRADESWADHLLRLTSSGAHEGFTPDADRLLVLSRTAVRLLAAGMVYAILGIENPEDLPFHLIDFLDRMYRARNQMEDRNAKQGLSNEFIEVFNKLKEKGQTGSKGGTGLHWLLELANPGIHRIRQRDDLHNCGPEPGELKGIRKRIKLLNRLHLTVQEFLSGRNVLAAFDDSPLERSLTGERRTAPIEEKYKPIQEFIGQVFTRYVIYHTHHWQKATQCGKTTGLRKFQLFFGAKQRQLMAKGRVDWEGLAAEKLSEIKPLRELEGRLSPPSRGASQYIPWLLAFAKQAKENELDKFGIVVHFRKEEYKNFENPGTDTSMGMLDLRCGRIRRKTRTDAFKLFRLLSSPNQVVPFIVGIDAANLELTTPPEVFAPAFRFLREYPIKLNRLFTTRETYEGYKEVADLVENRRLGMTYHVGEDFRHILSGLRAIHEVIEFLKPVPGDRLGHAIALALDPEVWAFQVGYQAVLPRQEWLDTLVWVHHLLGAGHDLIGQLSLEDEIQLHSRGIYFDSELAKRDPDRVEQDWQPATLYDSWRLRQIDPYSLETSHLKDNKFRICSRGHSTEQNRWADIQTAVLNEVDKSIGTEAAYHLVKLYWYSRRVCDMGSRIITIDMAEKKDLWLKVCKEVQEQLQQIVLKKQLVIEVNPSSNRIIGPMARIADHPVFRLTLDKQDRLSRKGRVTINTDNPGVFATSLTHEFYLLGEILVNRGVPEAEVVEWLDWLRKNGKNYSFLRSLPDAKDKRVLAILDNLLKRYEPMMRCLRGEQRIYEPPKSPVHIKTNVELEEENKELLARIKQLEYKIG
jgi:hypothetical protein